MNLQEILGDKYDENMSITALQDALNNGNYNFVDLSQGGYVDINKHNREINNLQTQVNTLTNEKTAAQNAQKDANDTSAADKAQIESLQNQLKQMGIENNKNSAVARMASTVDLLGIKNTDTEYTTFIDNIAELEKDKSTSIADYISKQVKNAYEKGKQDATKNSLGSLGKQHGSSEKAPAEKGDLGKQLAQLGKVSTESYYFKR